MIVANAKTREEITDVRAGYDRIAEEYARRISDELRNKPLDCKLLDRFADSVRGTGIACDLGCGPGHVGRYLQNRGVEICGVDLSPAMIETARRLNPGIEFHTGDMRALSIEDKAWAGIAAFYSIVNLPSTDVAKALHEMLRVLTPGGRLLIAFHMGDDRVHTEEDLWGLGVTLHTTLFRVSTIERYLLAAGFKIDEIIERDPYAPEVEYQSRRAYIFAHKPVKTTSA